MSKIKELRKIAKEMGVTLQFVRIKHTYGNYSHRDRRIVISTYRPNYQHLYTLAHELGHVYYKHDGRIAVRDKTVALNEWKAWKYAARLAKKFGFYSRTFIKEVEESKRYYLFLKG